MRDHGGKEKKLSGFLPEKKVQKLVIKGCKGFAGERHEKRVPNMWRRAGT